MALPPNNNYLYGNTNLPYENNNQIAFAPDSKKDKTIKTLYENKDMYGDTPAYKQLRERDVEQFNKGKGPLSLPPEEYKGIEGYTANAFGYPQATMTDANSYITRKTPTDTFQSMFQNVDTGRYNTNQNTRYNTNQNTNFGIGSSRGADQNYTGITRATQNQTPYKFTNDEQGPIVDQEMQEYFNTLPKEEKEGFGKFLSNAGVNIGNFARDKAMPALKDAAGRTIASQALSTAGAMVNPYLGLAGLIFGGFKGGNIFNAPYRGATQGGGGYTIDQLNKQNARGGYYTDTARGQRQQANRVENMLNRAADGKSYSRKNLESLSGLSGSNLDRTITDKKTAAPGHIGNENTTGTGGGKSIVCTAMYQTTGLQDWAKAMKVWYIYQKRHLSDAHQEGYHLLFKPFVKGMHKNKIIRAVGAHVAKHRTQELKHILFNSKSDTLGKIYNKILEPICYIVGKIKFIFKKK